MEGEKLELISGDPESPTTKVWSEWMASVAFVRNEFAKRLQKDAFCFNEAASVGILAGAATRIGGLALTDYRLTKRHSSDPDRESAERADLFLALGGQKWIFEFKTRFHSLNDSKLADGRKEALNDIRRNHELDGSIGKAGVICHFGYSEEHLLEKYAANVEELARGAAHAWRFDQLEHASLMYILFWDQ